MNTTNGKIAEQSKQKMVKALLLVMKQYTFKEITVTQIAQEAKLSRKTFYRLFSGKADVLTLLFDGLFYDCLSQIKEQKVHSYWDVVQLYFNFWEERKDLMILMQKSDLLPLVFEYSYQHSMEVFEQVRSNQVMLSFALPLPYMLAYSVGGMHSMLLKWVEKGMSIPSAELIQQLKTGFQSADI